MWDPHDTTRSTPDAPTWPSSLAPFGTREHHAPGACAAVRGPNIDRERPGNAWKCHFQVIFQWFSGVFGPGNAPKTDRIVQDSLGPHEVLATIIRTGLVAKESLREPRTTPRLTDNLRRRGGLSGSRAKRFRSVSQSRKLTYGILWPTGRLRLRHRRPRAPRPWPARPSPAWAGARGARGTRGKASPARSKPRTPLNKSFHPKGYQT